MPMSPRLLRPRQTGFTPRSISGLALWLDAADSQTLYTTDAGPVTAVSSPLDISGCGLWLDASNADSLTLNGNTVSEWRDLSGNARHFSQATAASQPNANSRTQNGRRVLDFTGAQSLNGNAASLSIAKNVGGLTIFVVGQFDVVASTTMAMLAISRSDVSNSVRAALVYLLGTNQILIGGRRLDADAFASAGYSPNANVNILTGTLDYTNSDAFIWQGGALQSSNTSFQTNGSTTNADSLAVVVGNDGSGTQALDGWIGEVIVYPSALPPTDRARVESYLAAKWGISGVHAQATATNDPVGAWLDKSGNGRHATQATGASRPTVSSIVVNARRALGFNGTTSRLALPSMDSTPSTVLAVARHNSGTSSAARTPLSIMEGGNYMTWQFQQTGTIRAGVTYNASQNHFTASGIDPQGSVLLLSGQMSAGGGGLLGRLNGAALPGVDVIPYADGAQSRIGCRFRNADDQFWSGEVCEVLHYQSALSLSQVQRIERYLASKWNITLAPQVSNADAQDWINRVYANGGTVSATTASAVNTFCDSITNAGIRDRFYRLNLFCGNSDASLAAVRTPLYRGPSLGGTQYGNALDTNLNFVAGDYSEAAGLLSNGTTKYLNSTISPDTLGVPQTLHYSVYKGAASWSVTQEVIGTRDADDFYQLQLRSDVANSATGYIGPTSINGVINAPVTTGAALLTLSRASSTSLVLYSNGVSVGVGSAASATLGACANNWFVFARNASGSAGFGTVMPLFGYSVGLGLDAPQQLAFYNASRAFHLALGRSA